MKNMADDLIQERNYKTSAWKYARKSSGVPVPKPTFSILIETFI
jgi:hypothetical protein